MIIETQATLLSEALKSNTTLMKLNLGCEHIRKENEKTQSCTRSHSIYYHNQIANFVRTDGATALSEALNVNTTLTDLSLYCEFN